MFNSATYMGTTNIETIVALHDINSFWHDLQCYVNISIDTVHLFLFFATSRVGVSMNIDSSTVTHSLNKMNTTDR